MDKNVYMTTLKWDGEDFGQYIERHELYKLYIYDGESCLYDSQVSLSISWFDLVLH